MLKMCMLKWNVKWFKIFSSRCFTVHLILTQGLTGTILSFALHNVFVVFLTDDTVIRFIWTKQ